MRLVLLIALLASFIAVAVAAPDVSGQNYDDACVDPVTGELQCVVSTAQPQSLIDATFADLQLANTI